MDHVNAFKQEMVQQTNYALAYVAIQGRIKEVASHRSETYTEVNTTLIWATPKLLDVFIVRDQ